MFVGALAVTGLARPGPQTLVPEFPLHATASHSGDGFAMATGNIDEDVDGLYTLDYVTGDLRCFVFNPRTLNFTGLYATNVNNDLGYERGKKPSYVMVTGLVSWKGGTFGATRPGNALVYVADANTGNFAAYGLFTNRQASSIGALQKDALRKVAVGKGRVLAVRDSD
jgi:hypothetical protein